MRSRSLTDLGFTQLSTTKKAAPLGLAFFLFLEVFAYGQPSPADASAYISSPPKTFSLKLASVYLEQAIGAPDSASGLAITRRGLELEPASSDLLMQFAGYESSGAVDFHDALDALAKSIDANNWFYFHVEDADARYVALLLRSRQLSAAEAFLKNRVTKVSFSRNEALFAAQLELAGLQNNKAELARLETQAAAVFPFGARCKALEFRFSDGIPLSASSWMDRNYKNSDDYRQALYWYIAGLVPSQERIDRAGAYFALGGKNAYIAALAIDSLSRISNVPAGAFDAWLKNWVDASRSALDLKAWEIVFASADRAKIDISSSAEMIAPALGAWKAYLDSDEDGYPEVRLSFAAGTLERLGVDDDQDGHAERTVVFKDGVPRSYVQTEGRSSVRVDYGLYPDIADVWVQQDTSRILHYRIPYGALDFQALQLRDGIPSGPRTALALARSGLAGLQANLIAPASAQMDEIVWEATGTVIGIDTDVASLHPWRKTTLVGGKIRAVLESSRKNQVFDHLVWYSKGQPLYGFRDLREDGSFESMEEYTNGKLSRVVYSGNADGIKYIYDALSRTGEMSVDPLNKDSRREDALKRVLEVLEKEFQ